MSKFKTLKGTKREELLEALYKRYAQHGTWRQQLTYLRKKYAWLFIVEGTKVVKRVLDVILATFLLILLFPFMILAALAIKLYDGGPIFYITDRVGKWGKEFRFLKFRTMRVGADQLKKDLISQSDFHEEKRFKMKHDPRITPLGRILRKSSFDELPQLWNIVKGDMSLVGPRPPLPNEVASYTLDDRRRLDVIPGLTCIWQVKGRSQIPFDQQVKLDLQYIESQSILMDMKLLLLTIPAVLLGRGAY
jgi:lipopolysaccharide/colanic/teichoic acid biosynthesis glycosyltransferase